MSGPEHGHIHSAACACSYEAKQADLDIGASLYASVDKERMFALNESDAGSAAKCIKPHDARLTPEPFLASEDDDPELIVFVPFTQQVMLKSFCVVAGSEATAPTRVKIFVNRNDVDFSSAADMDPAQAFDLAYDPLGEVEYPVRINRFQNAASLLLFFTNADAPDDTHTRINYLGFKGTATKNKREVVRGIVYESQANPADHQRVGGDAQGALSSNNLGQ
jgi:hypothetical protein